MIGSSTSTIPRSLLGLFTATALVVCGCAPLQEKPEHQPSHYRSPKVSKIRRAVLLPLHNETRYDAAADLLQNELTRQFRGAGFFDVIELSVEDLAHMPPSWVTPSGYNEAVVINVARKFRADAVIVGKLTDFHPYWPPRVGASIHVIDPRESIVLASVDGQWDAANERVAAGSLAYHKQKGPYREIPNGNLATLSPQHFNRYVASQMVEGLSKEVAPTEKPLKRSIGSSWSILPGLRRQR